MWKSAEISIQMCADVRIVAHVFKRNAVEYCDNKLYVQYFNAQKPHILLTRYTLSPCDGDAVASSLLLYLIYDCDNEIFSWCCWAQRLYPPYLLHIDVHQYTSNIAGSGWLPGRNDWQWDISGIQSIALVAKSEFSHFFHINIELEQRNPYESKKMEFVRCDDSWRCIVQILLLTHVREEASSPFGAVFRFWNWWWRKCNAPKHNKCISYWCVSRENARTIPNERSYVYLLFEHCFSLIPV